MTCVTVALIEVLKLTVDGDCSFGLITSIVKSKWFECPVIMLKYRYYLLVTMRTN